MALSEKDTERDLRRSIHNVRDELSALERGVHAELSALTLRTHAGTVIAASAQEAYGSVSGSAISGGTASEYGVEQISNISRFGRLP
jgi:hypothetical protein